MTDLRDLLADIDHALAAIRKELTPALASMAGKATTGYPTSTRLDGSPHATGTGDGLVGLAPTTPTSRARTLPHPDRPRLDHAIRQAAQHLATARGIVHQHTPPGEAAPDPGRPGCTSCARIGQHTDRNRGDLCAWCYRYRTCHHPGQKADMPARELVAIYHDRGKVTARDLQNVGARL